MCWRAWYDLPGDQDFAEITLGRKERPAYAETHSMQAGGENEFSPRSAKAVRGKSATTFEPTMIIDIGAAVQAETVSSGVCFQQWMQRAQSEARAGDVGYPIC